MGGNSTEPGLPRFEVAEHRIAEYEVAVAGHAAARRARLRPWRLEIDQPLRFGHRQRLHQDLMKQRKQRGRRADAEREHHDNHDRQGRTPPQRPEREPDVVEHRVYTLPGCSIILIAMRR